jgi:hypothetical protein
VNRLLQAPCIVAKDRLDQLGSSEELEDRDIACVEPFLPLAANALLEPLSKAALAREGLRPTRDFVERIAWRVDWRGERPCCLGWFCFFRVVIVGVMDFRLHNNVVYFGFYFGCSADCLTPVFTKSARFYSQSFERSGPEPL